VGDYRSAAAAHPRTNGNGARYGHAADASFGRYQQRYVDPEVEANGNGYAVPPNGHSFQAERRRRSAQC
jgi:hypothetical protein